MSYPISVKGVLLIDAKVLLVRNGCRLRGQFKPMASTEHSEFGLHALADLERIPMPAGYARSIKSWSMHAES